MQLELQVLKVSKGKCRKMIMMRGHPFMMSHYWRRGEGLRFIIGWRGCSSNNSSFCVSSFMENPIKALNSMIFRKLFTVGKKVEILVKTRNKLQFHFQPGPQLVKQQPRYHKNKLPKSIESTKIWNIIFH